MTISAQGGTIAASREEDSRVLDVDLRLGTADLDSTHVLRGFSSMEGSFRGRTLLPRDNDPALVSLLRAELDKQYRDQRLQPVD